MEAKYNDPSVKPEAPLGWRVCTFGATKAVSEIGDQFSVIGIGLYLYGTTGNISWIAIVWAAKAAVRMTLQPFAGVWVDRWPVRTVLLGTACVNAVIATGMALSVGGSTAAIVALVALSQIVQLLDGPAVGKMVPLMVQKPAIVRTNAYLRSILTVGALVGPALGGVVYGTLGATWLFGMNAASYGVAVAGTLILRIKDENSGRESTGRYFLELRQGFSYALRQKLVLTLMILAFFDSMAWRAIEIAHVPASEELFKFGASGLGLAYTCLTVGSLLGAAILVKHPHLVASMSRTLLAYCFLGLPVLAISAFPDKYVVFAAMLASGAILEAFGVGARSFLQTETPIELQGRVFSLYGTCLAAGAMPLAVGIQPLVDSIGLRGLYLGAGGLLLITGVSATISVIARNNAPPSGGSKGSQPPPPGSDPAAAA